MMQSQRPVVIKMSNEHVIGYVHRDSPETQSGFYCVVLKASTVKDCEEIICRIGEDCHVDRQLLNHVVILTHLYLLFLFFLQLLVSNIQNGLYDNESIHIICDISCT